MAASADMDQQGGHEGSVSSALAGLDLEGRPGIPMHDTTQAILQTQDVLSVTEQEILANIQELQGQLRRMREEQEARQGLIDTQQEEAPKPADMRVIVVANRLPIKASRDEVTGEWVFAMSSGGLVTALQGAREEMNFVWIGWLEVSNVPEAEQDLVRTRLMEEYSCVPLFLDEDLVDKYYNGFSNDVLWPLFHYVPLPMYKAGGEKKFDSSLWDAYKTANIKFADVVSSVYKDGDFVWVHDYHLMRLPYELRQRHPKCRIGWFLHTPFPSSEIYRILPVRKPLLEGMLSADLVGFHTYDYARHFLSACSRVLEVECSPRGVDYNNHFMSLGVFPIGIDPDHVSKALKTPWVQTRIRELRETFVGRKILLGVDRLDYIKGMPHKLLGLELFFTRYPEWHGKVTLIQVGVPSRTEVPEYKALANQINELVGRINGTYGTLEYSPVHYINQHISQEELFAIYNVADVCMVTSVRDGMNLVSHEYVAAQHQDVFANESSDLQPKDGPGVLILSEFAGSAQSLSGAIRVNPWNTDQLAGAIKQALTLSRVERELRQHKLYRYVSMHTACFWAKSFMQEFREVCDKRKKGIDKLPTLPIKEVRHAYAEAKRRLIISDYDGTLTQLQSLPQLAGPPPFVTSLLENLCRDPKNTLFIISGRERRFMDRWFGNLRVGLAAEYGFYYRLPNQDQWQCAGQGLDLTWKNVVHPIMQYFTERTPGTYIENKESSLTWHYRDADPHFGLWQAKDMQINMEDSLSNMPLEILQGNRMVEVRHQAANKSFVADRVLKAMSEPAARAEHGEVDFVLCVGDDRSDEDMFTMVQRLRDQARASPPSPEMRGMAAGRMPSGASLSAMSAADEQTHTGNAEQSSRDDTSSMATGERGDHERDNPPRCMARNANVYTVHIGQDQSQADYKLDSLVSLRQLLRKLDSDAQQGQGAPGSRAPPFHRMSTTST
eukprot:TRINITY_DN1376_c0_g1_i1.p1 TRINITY_DN1376_c0_g1~~TRINITY_DN1376_c0_g1_i1.p1  ORF type:complete len:1060 (-),score=283.32 TRINITY_DN1376_c0_g1_i1:298-3147(-)